AATPRDAEDVDLAVPEDAEEPIDQVGQPVETEGPGRGLRFSGAGHVDRDRLDATELRPEGRHELDRGADPVEEQEWTPLPFDGHAQAEAVDLDDLSRFHEAVW